MSKNILHICYKFTEMTHAEKHIVETYARIFENLSSISKLELIEKLSKSIRKETKSSKEKDFYKSFGTFASEKSADDIVKEIKESRKFREKDLEL
jgi:hypothetical protein